MRGNNNIVAWGMTNMVQELQRLIAYGVIGIYRSFEITEILGFRQGQPSTQPPVNFLSLAVAEPADPPAGEIPEMPFLNQKRLVLPGSQWNIGVARYRIPVQVLVDAVNRFSQTGEWKAGRNPLQVGALAPVAPQFIPANSHQEHPWNRVLKNNFWEGSHVLELFDTSKHHVRFLLDDSRMLTNLATAIRPHVPMELDGLSDRLGNVLIQLPVNVISTGVRNSPEGDPTVTLAWHPQVQPRTVRVFSEVYEDSAVEAFDAIAVASGAASLKLHSPGGGARTHIWDDQHRVLLGASPVTLFVTSMAFSMHAIVAGQEPVARQFFLPEAGGAMKPQSVVLRRLNRPQIIGSTPQRPREPWRSNRIFAESLAALQGRKEFVQYGKVAGTGRTEALDDIRWLMNEHGTLGVWLWDPYLNADDVLRTLFFCPHKEAKLRALTSGDEPPSRFEGSDDIRPLRAKKKIGRASCKINLLKNRRKFLFREASKQSWENKQAARLDLAKGNCEGLSLEFRIRKGGAGWPFHDRFIIFPKENGPAIAWSLGTSVNSLGLQHHIVQKVSNGELIANAFQDLWNKLNAPEYLVWKT